MEVVLLILAGFCLYGYIRLHKSADESAAKFANRPSVIVDPKTDLSLNQKYAILGLLSFLEAAVGPISLRNELSIISEIRGSLGLSTNEIEKYMKVSMRQSPDLVISRMINSLKEFKDKNYLGILKEKCIYVAESTLDLDVKEATLAIFKELGV